MTAMTQYTSQRFSISGCLGSGETGNIEKYIIPRGIM
jgi:hypothetical protein